MRRVWLLAGLVFLAGCDNSLFKAHADVAAEAAGQDLTSERLAAIMGDTKGIRITRDAAEMVSNIWIDYTLFSQAVARGTIPTDSASIAEAMWARIAEIRGSRWFDTLVARQATARPADADRFYAADSARVLQHILFRVEPSAEPPAKAKARRAAEATLARIRAGADFGSLATELSGDPGSARDSGYYPPTPRGTFVTAFDSAGWALGPGEVSGVVETPFGYHIIKRPTQQQAQARILNYLQTAAGAQVDSLYRDSLARVRDLKVSGDAPALIRGAVTDPQGAANSSKTVASWKGGKFTQGDLMRWIYALPPQAVSQANQAPDEQLAQFARLLAENELLLREAAEQGIGLTPDEWQTMQQEYRAEVDTLEVVLGLGQDVTDSSVAKDERSKVAALKMEQYFDGLVKGTSRVRRLPAPLSTILRKQGKWKINEAGLTHAVEIAEAAKGPDSTAAPAPGGMQPAPGAPPLAPDSGAGK